MQNHLSPNVGLGMTLLNGRINFLIVKILFASVGNAICIRCKWMWFRYLVFLIYQHCQDGLWIVGEVVYSPDTSKGVIWQLTNIATESLVTSHSLQKVQNWGMHSIDTSLYSPRKHTVRQNEQGTVLGNRDDHESRQTLRLLSSGCPQEEWQEPGTCPFCFYSNHSTTFRARQTWSAIWAQLANNLPLVCF